MFRVLNSGAAISLGIFLHIACSLAPPTADAQAINIIDLTYGAGAGSFELGHLVNGGGIPELAGPDYMGVAPGDHTTIVGWTVGGPGDGVDWVTGPTYRADTGNRALDLRHTTKSSIATVIPTIDGQVYELSFGVAAVYGADSNTGIVSAGSLVNQAFTVPVNGSIGTQTFTPFHFLFTALSSTTTIEFAATGLGLKYPQAYGPVIDSVSVVLVDPIPVPIAYYPLDEPGGTIAQDAVGSVDGTLQGGATFAPGEGIKGGAIRLDRTTGDLVNMGDHFGFTSGDFSIEAWVQLNSGDTTPSVPVGKHVDTISDGYFLAVNDTSDGYGSSATGKAHFYDSGFPNSGVSPAMVNDGRWHHLVGVYGTTNNTVSIYVDGELQSSGSRHTIVATAAPFLVGGVSVAGSPTSRFTGLIDEVRVYDHALSVGAARAIYLNTRPALVAVQDTYPLTEDQSLSVSAPGVLADDILPNDSSSVTVLADSAPAHAARFALHADGSFIYRPAGNFHGRDRFTYHIYDGFRSSNLTTVIINVGSVNDAPTADPGPDQTVRPGSKVRLSAVNSADDGGIAGFRWKQTSGVRVRLSKSTASRPVFTAPQVGAEGASLIFKLTVGDHLGLRSSDRCIVSVSAVNQPPVAMAGQSQNVAEGQLVQLDASGSHDTEGGGVTCRWDQIGGRKVTLSDPSLVQPSFAAPQAGPQGAALSFRLTVTDSEGLKAEDITIVNVVTSNKPPQARARAPKTARGGTLVTLVGSGSSDRDDGIATYRWTQTSGPPAKLSNPWVARPTFKAPKAGPGGIPLTFRLYVTDFGGLQSLATCQVKVR